MDIEQPKRRPGRPTLASKGVQKEARTDIHLWLPDTLLVALDAKRSTETRTEYIQRILAAALQ